MSPRITATDTAPSIWGVAEFISKRPDVDILVLIQVTSPFVKSEHLKLAVKQIQHPVPFDCIFSVVRTHKLRWTLKQGKAKPLNFNTSKRPRRQDWDGELVETGGFYIFRTNIVESGFIQNSNCTVWEVSQEESLEIDSEYDILVADRFLYTNRAQNR
ncbi:unnamed protein product [Leptidea sinapis]|uniref:N-acylneuraminate cytidylyltransferase n=1 Tax=Leptidea sinapis TaxID=189913 RepID=A0A5E4QPY3_9NEOP|nr:unnamed protein product [Leptidea sinapis]